MDAGLDAKLGQGWKYYFAYGSNLRRAQMDKRCGAGYAPICSAELPGYRLAFVGEGTARWGRGGVATVLPEPGANVPGAIYAISAIAEAALDGFEGVDAGMYLKVCDLLQHEGQPVLLYVASADLLPENPPSAKYLSAIREGYRDWGLDQSAL